MNQHLLSFSVVILKQLSFANAEMHGVGQMKFSSHKHNSLHIRVNMENGFRKFIERRAAEVAEI